jgi:myo-inositol-1(or 4)-monophosphatase
MEIYNTSEMREFGEYKDFAVDVARQGGNILLDRYGKVQEIEYKLRTDFKTKTDDEVDNFLRKLIQEKYPNHNIYSEELPPTLNESEYAWVNDPLDGTFNFTNGFINMFSVSIGLARGKEPIVGVINAPKMGESGELYVAQKGEGAYMNGNRIAVANTTDINKAMVAMDLGKLNRQQGIYYLNKMLQQDKGVRCSSIYACASVSMAQVAAGRLDAYVGLNLEPWDMAGAVPILREAGAKVTNIEGKEWDLEDESVLAANPGLHQKLLELFIEQ